MSTFKFLHTRHVETLLKGKFLFRHAEYFRSLEDRGGLIGDPNESKSTAKLHDGKRLINNKVIFMDEVFIFCVSFGDIDSLTKVMCNDKNGYDACIEIKNIGWLAKIIWEEGSEVNSGKKVSELFRNPLFGPVRYEDSKMELFESMKTITPPSFPLPFKKSSIYSGQSEIRIVLYPKSTFKDDKIFITVQLPDGFLETRFVNLLGTVVGRTD